MYRALGTSLALASPATPKVPRESIADDPLSQVHCDVVGLNCHKSLSAGVGPVAVAGGEPPNSHKFPAGSVQEVGAKRAPGVVDDDGVPSVPYTEGAPPVFDPAIHVQGALLPVLPVPPEELLLAPDEPLEDPLAPELLPDEDADPELLPDEVDPELLEPEPLFCELGAWSAPPPQAASAAKTMAHAPNEKYRRPDSEREVQSDRVCFGRFPGIRGIKDRSIVAARLSCSIPIDPSLLFLDVVYVSAI